MRHYKYKKKNNIQRKTFSKYEKENQIIKAISNNFKFKSGIRWKSKIESKTFPSESRITRVKNYCISTCRKRSIYRFLKLSRIELKRFATSGKLPGLSKTSW